MKFTHWKKLFFESFAYAKKDKKVRLVVLIWFLMIFGIIAIFAAALGPLQPFIYALF